MPDNGEIRTISFDRPDDIMAAIRNRETFEVGGCQGRMSDAVLFLERAIGGEGLTSRVYTKGRVGALIPALLNPAVAIAVAAGMAAHNLATLNPDYEIMKRPVDKALRVSYVKDAPGLGAKALDAASAVGQGVVDAAKKTASLASDAASAAGQGVAVAAEKTTSMASDAANSVAAAWDKHAPTKEAVVGALVVGGVGSLMLKSDEIDVIGARTLAAVSKAASTVSDAAGAAATVVKHNRGAVIAGAVVGVGVAAAPFTGGGSLLGAATMATSLAGVSGIATAGAGAAISNIQRKKIERAFGEGIERGKADSAVKIEELSKMMAHAAKVYSAQTKLNEFIVSLAAVGFAMAACTGPVSDEESACVEEYLTGMSKIALPQSIRDRLHEIAETPPDFEQAISYVRNFDRQIWPVIDGLLQVISEADGDVNESELEFLNKWECYKEMAQNEGLPNE